MLAHRWMGIAGGLLIVVWFASGFVMLYARMPVLQPAERLERLPPLDLGTARIAPAAAAESLPGTPQRMRVGMIGSRPVYRFPLGSGWRTVFADSGEPLSGLSAETVVRLTAGMFPELAAGLTYGGYLTAPDQWTLQSRGLLPMHRLDANDALGTVVYFSDRTGEPVLVTTRRGRLLAQLGAVPHWIYYTALRRHSAVWLQTLIWLSLAGSVLCLSGLVWGLLRFSPRGSYRLHGAAAASPYSGWLRWHHYSGLVFGLFAFTWMFSGLLSLEPWGLDSGTAPTAQESKAFGGGAVDLRRADLESLTAGATALAADLHPKELEVLGFRGEVFLVAYKPPRSADRASASNRPWSTDDPSAMLSPVLPFAHLSVSLDQPAATLTRLARGELMAAAAEAVPGAAVQEAAMLSAFDGYYYGQHRIRPLPVLRIRYDDPAATTLYVDPRLGTVLLRTDRSGRLNRWLYHGLHSLDFPFLLRHRLVRQAVTLLLLAGGLAISCSSLWPGVQRLGRTLRRLLPQRR